MGSVKVSRPTIVEIICGVCNAAITEKRFGKVAEAIACYCSAGWKIVRHRDKTATATCPDCIAKAAAAKAEHERALGLALAQRNQAQERLDALRQREAPTEPDAQPEAADAED